MYGKRIETIGSFSLNLSQNKILGLSRKVVYTQPKCPRDNVGSIGTSLKSDRYVIMFALNRLKKH